MPQMVDCGREVFELLAFFKSKAHRDKTEE